MKAFHVNALPTVYIIAPTGEVAEASHSPDVPAVVSGLLNQD